MAGLLRLGFDEPIDPSTFIVQGVTLMQYAYTGYGGHHQLTNYTSIWTADTGRSLWIKLCPRDIFFINSVKNLAHIRDQAFLIIDNGTICDTTGWHFVRLGTLGGYLVA